MKNSTTMMTDSNAQKRQTFGKMLQSEQDEYSYRRNSTSDMFPPRPSDTFSPHNSAVYDQSPSRFSIPTPSGELTASPLSKSPWSSYVPPDSCCYTGLVGSLIREEGHIYSLAASGDLLYTGSESKNIRVWKNQKEFSGFKSNSGLVKAIVLSGEKIFSGHQDGKIRVWKATGKNQSVHKRIGTMPTVKATITKSLNPSNYVEVRRNRNAIWIKHVDAISSLSLSEDRSLLYSASWDKTIKVWRISDSKCLESIHAHDDAVNSIVSGFDGLIFTGSADGSVKVWRREMQGKGMKHFFSQTLLKQECAVTSLAVDPSGNVLYSGSSDGMVNFWEREKFLSHGGVLRGHKLGVLCLATVGNLVLSGSADTNICIWKRELEGEHVYLSVLSGHSGPVKCLAVEEEEEGAYYCGGDKQYIIYSGSLDKSVKIWRVSGTGPVATHTPRLSGPPPQIPLPSQNVSSQVGGAVSQRTRD